MFKHFSATVYVVATIKGEPSHELIAPATTALTAFTGHGK